MSETIIGIDLGTTNTVVAIWSSRKCLAKVIKIGAAREPLMPSIVAYDDAGYTVRWDVDGSESGGLPADYLRAPGGEYEGKTALEIAETIQGWESEERKQGKAEVAALLRSAAEPGVRGPAPPLPPQPRATAPAPPGRYFPAGLLCALPASSISENLFRATF